jgi:DNA-binding SARP family transcriptional activator
MVQVATMIDAEPRPEAEVQDRLLTEVFALRQQVAALYAELVLSRPDRHRPGSTIRPGPAGASRVQPALYATLFGAFAIYRKHSPVPFGRRRVGMELCCFLLARGGQPVPRDELLELLWPEVDRDRALHRLHVAISDLRQVLDERGASESLVQLDEDRYSTAAHRIVTDCDVFEEHYRQGRMLLARGARPAAAEELRRALSLYTGDFLADLPDADWTHGPRTHYAERRLSSLELLCEHAVDSGDHVSVVEYAHQIIRADNLRERPHRHLMRSHYRLGQRACAIRQYQSCARLLADELGVRPSHETQRLFAAIRDDAELPAEAPLRL